VGVVEELETLALGPLTVSILAESTPAWSVVPLCWQRGAEYAQAFDPGDV